MRPPLLLSLLFLVSLLSCTPPVSESPPTAERPDATILTVLLELRPPADTLVLFRAIRGPGRLRADLPARLDSLPAAGQLTFTFLSAGERIRKQTSRPYPGPNEYEAPDGKDGFVRVVLPEEPRLINLRTQDTGGLRWLEVTGITPAGRTLFQRFDLSR